MQIPNYSKQMLSDNPRIDSDRFQEDDVYNYSPREESLG